MTTEEYIRDERFKAFGLCYYWLDKDYETTKWVTHDDIPAFLGTIDWSRTAVLAHNAQFDVAILSWLYDIRPAFIFDSLSMARALRGVESGNSLAKLAEEFALPPKGRAVHSTDGLSHLTEEIENELAEYCAHDVFLCVEVFKRLVKGYPRKELQLIDLTLKMFTEPKLLLDSEMLEEAIDEEREQREELLARLGVEDSALASNPKFASLLESLGCDVPYKVSKTTNKKTLALSKKDAHFQALLNSERADIRLLCETRLRVKSTLERTRAQRFLDISRRGTLPVPLNYYGAHTGRWSASRGSGINMQNMKRESFLRKSILAPKGYKLIVSDLSQIEPRVLAYLADHAPLLEMLKTSDPYSLFGAQMFNIPGMNKETHPVERQSAKSALLGCFGADTPVLTQRGWVPIVKVQVTDTVWDGQEWVQHEGRVLQGEKEVLTMYGVSATSDHEILTEHGWVEWSEVLANPSHFLSALRSASLPVWVGSADLTAPNGKASSHTNHACAVPADGKALLNGPIFAEEEQHGATPAQRKKPRPHAWLLQGMKPLAQTEGTEKDCLTASVQLSFAAPTPQVKRIRTMVGAVLQYTLNGLKTALRSCATWLASTVGMCRNYNSTASITTAGTSPVIFDLSAEASIWQTKGALAHVVSKSLNDGSKPLKQRMQTYDIEFAGPRNRYTILTSHGPLIVHNCGYGLGWASFAAQLLTGFLGAPPLRYTKKDARALGVTAEKVQRFIDWEVNLQKMAEIPHTCTKDELLVHCIVAKEIIDKYREASEPVLRFWEMCQTLIEHSLYKGNEYTYKCLTFRKGEVVLPSGLCLRYPDLGFELDAKGRKQWFYGEHKTKLYGGKLTENIVQAVARCVMTDGMLRIQERFQCLLTVHDEVVVLCPETMVSEGMPWVYDQMVADPEYMPGIPLKADIDAAQRYGDAK